MLAIPIPDSMLWIQRRQFYRVRVPLGVPAYLEVDKNSGGFDKFTLHDISAGGLAFIDVDNRFKLEPGTLIENCRLFLPEHANGEITLEVKGSFPVNRNKREAGQRVGCTFVNLNMGFGAHIQRYIHTLEILQKRTED